MSDPIPGIAKKLYRIFHQDYESAPAPKWEDIPFKEHERWIQVAASACIAALGSDHLTNALSDTRAELAKRDAELERLRAENAAKAAALVDAWKERDRLREALVRLVAVMGHTPWPPQIAVALSDGRAALAGGVVRGGTVPAGDANDRIEPLATPEFKVPREEYEAVKRFVGADPAKPGADRMVDICRFCRRFAGQHKDNAGIYHAEDCPTRGRGGGAG